MSRRGVYGLWELVRDLWRELPPLMRAGLFAGVGLGLLFGLTFILRAPPDYGLLRGNRILYRTILLPRVAIVVVGAFVGGVVGAATGAVADRMFSRLPTISKDRRRSHTERFRRHNE
jgi:hypothetical protein